MRNVSKGLAGSRLNGRLLLLVLVAIAIAAVPRRATAEQASSPPKCDGSETADDALPLGKECVVVIDQKEGPTELQGRLKRVDEHWLVLHADVEARSVTRTSPVLSKIPYLNRLYKNVGIGRSRHDLWIPRERVLYLRVDAGEIEIEVEPIGIDFDFEIPQTDVETDKDAM